MIDVIFTPNAEHLSWGLENCKKHTYSDNSDDDFYFPDGEIYMRLEEIEDVGSPLLIASSGQGLLSPGEEVFLLYSTLRNINYLEKKGDMKLDKYVFFSLYPFGRQDQNFSDDGKVRKGEFITAKNIAEELLNHYAVKKIYTIDAHFYKENHTNPWFKEMAIENKSMAPEIMEHVRKAYGNDVIFIVADEGQKERMKMEGLEMEGSKKKRHDSYNVEVEGADINIRGKIVCIIDDLSASGNTQLENIKIYKEKGAKKVVPGVTHVTIPDRIHRLAYKADDFIYTDSVNVPGAQISVKPHLQKIINRLGEA